MTSSPGPICRASTPVCSACVPGQIATQNSVSSSSVNSFSNVGTVPDLIDSAPNPALGRFSRRFHHIFIPVRPGGPAFVLSDRLAAEEPLGCGLPVTSPSADMPGKARRPAARWTQLPRPSPSENKHHFVSFPTAEQEDHESRTSYFDAIVVPNLRDTIRRVKPFWLRYFRLRSSVFALTAEKRSARFHRVLQRSLHGSASGLARGLQPRRNAKGSDKPTQPRLHLEQCTVHCIRSLHKCILQYCASLLVLCRST